MVEELLERLDALAGRRCSCSSDETWCAVVCSEVMWMSGDHDVIVDAATVIAEVVFKVVDVVVMAPM